MLIGIPRESDPRERRVAATPATVKELLKLGYGVVVEATAGERAAFSDGVYAEAGAQIGTPADVWSAPIVMKVLAPTDAEIAALVDGALLISLISPALNPELVDKLAKRDITVLAMDAVPRISRAQALDVLSSMANIAGYRAVVEAANEFGRFFTGQVTAAGKVPPATVLVAGVGVAGLAAIGTANSLGAIVKATDPRPEVAEQVQSMGAQFLNVDAEKVVSTDGYARETSDDYNAKAAELYSREAPNADIIITTALIPGRPAPRLITAEHVAKMKSGSVIVDMAAGSGGNVEGSLAGERVVTDNGVIILGYTDLAGRLPAQASQLYGQNLVNLLKLVTPEKDGEPVLDLDDVIIRGMMVVQHREVLWPPPPISVTAAPAPAAAAPKPVPEPKPVKQPMSATTRTLLLVAIAALSLTLFAFSPPAFLGHFMVFMLSVVIGFYVIGSVHHALHTPLMSVTNAISGIIVVGALLQIGRPGAPWWMDTIAFIAVLLASINIFGGFAVTRRMLAMFRKS